MPNALRVDEQAEVESYHVSVRVCVLALGKGRLNRTLLCRKCVLAIPHESTIKYQPQHIFRHMYLGNGRSYDHHSCAIW